MGSEQSKCSCGSYSTHKVTNKVTPNNDPYYRITRGFNSLFDDIQQNSGYKDWTYSGDCFKAYPCDKCVKIIVNNFNNNNIQYDLEKSNNGYWKMDLP